LREAASLATLDGLEGLSIGNLAASLGMSKSGLYAHFGSKQELQLATIDAAGQIFLDEVVTPALAVAPGITQLHVLCESFFAHLTRRTFPGGCFFAGAVLEMGTRPGPVKEKIADFQTMFLAIVAEFAGAAIERGELPSDDDPAQVAFDVNGILLAADAAFVTRGDERALELPRKAIARRLGPPVA
jgi:AcrR family transcriptional regulator